MKLELFISSYQWSKKWKGLQFQVLNKISGLDWIRSNTIESKELDEPFYHTFYCSTYIYIYIYINSIKKKHKNLQQLLQQ